MLINALSTDECASLETLKNCLRVFEQLKVIEKYVVSSSSDVSSNCGQRMIRLGAKYRDDLKLLYDFIADIQTYFD